MSESNFNRVAPVYDFLARLVFGAHLKKAQINFLNEINEGNNILVIGGGTGWILEELNKLNKQLKVVYVEPSAKMMALSKARTNISNLTIEYIQTPLLSTNITQHFDVVCTFFFLDVFDKKTVLKSIIYIEKLLSVNAKWLFSDFVLNKESTLSQKIVVKTMLLFFRICANIHSNKLLNYQQLIAQQGFEVMENRQWKKGLIHSTVFQKQ